MARDNAQDKAVSHRKAILHLKKSDPILADIIARIGPCRLEFGEPTFHALAESILYQQLNGKAAATIFDRFTALAGDPLTPLGILKLTDAQMRGVGLSRQKTAYLRDLAEKTKALLAVVRRARDARRALRIWALLCSRRHCRKAQRHESFCRFLNGARSDVLMFGGPSTSPEQLTGSLSMRYRGSSVVTPPLELAAAGSSTLAARSGATVMPSPPLGMGRWASAYTSAPSTVSLSMRC